MEQKIVITVRYNAGSEQYHYFNNISFPNEKPTAVFNRVTIRRKQLLENITLPNIEIFPKLLTIIDSIDKDFFFKIEYSSKDILLNILALAAIKDKEKDFYSKYIRELTVVQYFKLIEVLENLWINTYLE